MKSKCCIKAEFFFAVLALRKMSKCVIGYDYECDSMVYQK